MLYYVIIAIVMAEFCYSIFMMYLNHKASRRPIPEELSGIYDSSAYKRQQLYSSVNRRMSVITNVVNTIVSLLIFATGGYSLIDSVVREVTDSPVLLTLLFMGVIYLITLVIDIPFSYYSTFVIEERFGFNKTTHRTFFLDLLKSTVVSMILTALILSMVVVLYELMPRYYWIAAWGAVMLFTLFIQLFYSDLIVPLFNKQTPLQQGELRNAIETFAGQVEFAIKDIYVMDSSKRSTHANAYFTGFGPRKRIVLYDTLIEQLTTDEIVGVLAHEIGHYKHRHQIKGICSYAVTSLMMFFLFNLVIDSPEIAAAAGCDQPSFHINLIVFSMLYSPIDIVLSMFANINSRRHEWQADEYAKVHGKGVQVASGLRKMSANSLSNLTPHPVVVFMEYSHPTLLQRVRHLE